MGSLIARLNGNFIRLTSLKFDPIGKTNLADLNVSLIALHEYKMEATTAEHFTSLPVLFATVTKSTLYVAQDVCALLNKTKQKTKNVMNLFFTIASPSKTKKV